MKFTELPIKGMYKIELEPRGDERGFFSRVFCKREYEEHGLDNDIVQMNTTFTRDKGTFRGMHYQTPPKAEDKIIKVTKGSQYDITLDMRPNSPTFLQSYGIELNEENRTMVYIPKGCAHGYLILEDNTEVTYFVTEYYAPETEKVIRWNDPKLSIKLPFEPIHTSEKDMTAPDFDEDVHLKGMQNL